MTRTAQIDPRGTGNAALIADPANPLYKINFKHIPTGEKVSFTAWVTDFSDNFSSTWNEETTYGRMDPLVTFQNTQRSISMGLEVVAANKFEAINNTAKVDKLIRFLYPVYEDSMQAFDNTIKSSPLLEMEWVNFAGNYGAAGGPGDTPVAVDGLVGFLRNLNYTPAFESGLFLNNPEGGGTHLFPQQLKLQFDFKVIHTHMVGWTTKRSGHGTVIEANFAAGDSFPHGAGSETSNDLPGNCADGPWIPDSAINTSQDQRTRRLMMEENAATSEILSNPALTRQGRRSARQTLTARQGWNFNQGCEGDARTGRFQQTAAEKHAALKQKLAEKKALRKEKKEEKKAARQDKIAARKRLAQKSRYDKSREEASTPEGRAKIRKRAERKRAASRVAYIEKLRVAKGLSTIPSRPCRPGQMHVDQAGNVTYPCGR